ncbi:MAG: DUF998 domain-containing protein [Solirubrobacterales bacterium]
MQAENHITTISGTTQGFAVVILLLVAGTLVSLVSAHFIDRGVDPIRDAVSDFGAREHPWPYRIAAIWLGLAGLLTAVMLANAMFPKPTLTILALLVFAATRWAITIFPTDLEDEDETPVGHSHTVLAVIAFASICVASGAFLFETADDPFWHGKRIALGLTALAILITAILSAGERARHGAYFGLVERLLYLSMFGWFSVVALSVLTA